MTLRVLITDAKKKTQQIHRFMCSRKHQHMCRHLHTCTNTLHPYRMAHYKPASHSKGFSHHILCHHHSDVLELPVLV